MAETTYNDVFASGGASRDATCGPGEGTKKRQKLSCVKLAICPDHPRRLRPLKFCMRGRVREVVICFKFHENRSRGLRAVEVENRPLPLTRPMAYTTACTTVQAVITAVVYERRLSLRIIYIINNPSLLSSLPNAVHCAVTGSNALDITIQRTMEVKASKLYNLEKKELYVCRVHDKL